MTRPSTVISNKRDDNSLSVVVEQTRVNTARFDSTSKLTEEEQKSKVIANFIEKEKRHKKKSNSQQLIIGMFMQANNESPQPLERNASNKFFNNETTGGQNTEENTRERSLITPHRVSAHQTSHDLDYRLEDLPELQHGYFKTKTKEI